MSGTSRASAVLCEIEGVLFDTLPLRTAALHEAFAATGFAIGQDVIRRASSGRSTGDAIAVIVNGMQAPIDDLASDILELDAGRRFAARASASGVSLRPGAAAFVRSVRNHGLLAGVTRARRDEAGLMLALADLTDAFAFIITADDVVRGKPDPAGYIRALDRLRQRRRLASADVVAVEDSADGVAAARHAGVRTVLVGNHNAEIAFEADAWLPDLTSDDPGVVLTMVYSSPERGE
jgi:HAD superfamily hydrolase (TIGR01509 family)